MAGKIEHLEEDFTAAGQEAMPERVWPLSGGTVQSCHVAGAGVAATGGESGRGRSAAPFATDVSPSGSDPTPGREAFPPTRTRFARPAPVRRPPFPSRAPPAPRSRGPASAPPTGGWLSLRQEHHHEEVAGLGRKVLGGDEQHPGAADVHGGAARPRRVGHPPIGHRRRQLETRGPLAAGRRKWRGAYRIWRAGHEHDSIRTDLRYQEAVSVDGAKLHSLRTLLRRNYPFAPGTDQIHTKVRNPLFGAGVLLDTRVPR